MRKPKSETRPTPKIIFYTLDFVRFNSEIPKNEMELYAKALNILG